MECVQEYFLNVNKRELLCMSIGLQGIFVFAFVICSFAVSDTVNAGFNCVLTGLLNLGFFGGSYYVIKKTKAPIAVRYLPIT